jgi:hypothetical protein
MYVHTSDTRPTQVFTDTMKVTSQSDLINSQYNREFQLDQGRMTMRDKLRDVKSAATDKLVATLNRGLSPKHICSRKNVSNSKVNEDANSDRRC